MDATGVDVETATQPMDKTTLGLWAWVAEREVENIRHRTLMGREALARAGKLVTGNPPYGFRYDPAIKQLRHNTAEKPHVLTMFDWVDQGKSVNSLVTHFNQLGILKARSATAAEKAQGIRAELEAAQSQLDRKRLELQQLLT
jgi:DNA invertase Pin-like site-specific DNA recombinase